MPGSIQRRARRVRNAGLSPQRLRRAHLAAKRSRCDSIRLEGVPLAVTLPRIQMLFVVNRGHRSMAAVSSMLLTFTKFQDRR